MPITLARAKKHIADWLPQLPSRPGWPGSLFFAAHATTAAKIIKSGRLVCRRDLLGSIVHDIANQEALGTNPEAHNYVRLYFRPKTHFHLRTEGVKLLSDPYRLPAHMSIPVMFVFDFEKVVTSANVKFCDRKMAHSGIQPGEGDAYFDGIDFEKVYHDSGIADPYARQEINDRRMAEVLIPGSLPLVGNLKMIVCRTTFDAQSLLHLLGSDASTARRNVRAATKPAETFFCWGSYITDLQISNGTITLKVKPAKDYRKEDRIRLKIVQIRKAKPALEWDHDTTLSNNPMLIKGWDPIEHHELRIEIERALAFIGPPPIAQGTIFGK